MMEKALKIIGIMGIAGVLVYIATKSAKKKTPAKPEDKYDRNIIFYIKK